MALLLILFNNRPLIKTSRASRVDSSILHTFSLAHGDLLLLEVNDCRTVKTRSSKERNCPLLSINEQPIVLNSLQSRPLLTPVGILPQKWRRQNRIKPGKLHTTAPTPPALQRVQRPLRPDGGSQTKLKKWSIALTPTGSIASLSLEVMSN